MKPSMRLFVFGALVASVVAVVAAWIVDEVT